MTRSFSLTISVMLLYAGSALALGDPSFVGVNMTASSPFLELLPPTNAKQGLYPPPNAESMVSESSDDPQDFFHSIRAQKQTLTKAEFVGENQTSQDFQPVFQEDKEQTVAPSVVLDLVIAQKANKSPSAVSGAQVAQVKNDALIPPKEEPDTHANSPSAPKAVKTANEPPPADQPILPPATKTKIASAPEGNAIPKTQLAESSLSHEPPDLLGGAYLKSLNGNGGVISLTTLPAAPAPDVLDPLSLGEAVAFSLEKNYEVLASKSKIRQSWYNKIGAYSAYGPSVQYEVGRGPEYSAPAAVNDAFGNRVLHSTHPLLERSLTVRQPLIDLSLIADILTAHNDESIAEEDARDMREGTAYDTANIFLQLIQAHIAVKLADQYKSYLDDLANRMTVRLAGGGATKADLERIKGRATFAESAKIEALGEYRSNLSEFSRLTRVVPAKLQIPDTLSPPMPGDIQTAFDHAMQANPSYLSGLRKIDAAADERNKNASTLLPKMALQYSHNYTYDSAGSAQGNPVDGVYPYQTTDSFLLVATWAINGGTSVAASLATAEKEREMKLRARDIRDRLEQSIRTSYEAVNAARGRIAALQQAVKSNSRVVQDFESQYSEGNRTLFDLLDAYEQLYNARLNLMRIFVAEAQASFQIRRQMGELADAIQSVGEPQQ